MVRVKSEVPKGTAVEAVCDEEEDTLVVLEEGRVHVEENPEAVQEEEEHWRILRLGREQPSSPSRKALGSPSEQVPKLNEVLVDENAETSKGSKKRGQEGSGLVSKPERCDPNRRCSEQGLSLLVLQHH